ncbi:unnamed protein product [Polarella glacialis]|uniref:Uncharacterized protein n=1 Tax=Polarella glacialis TaxID=89957 RepID=A0A813FND5_POLGL|nr:unnamed protein product [Polarella glacialis]CAE8688387.1 unnamed protein product [Polarella glacialis]|mmetsp:Transcript_17055/g.30307  ORF Transcript_17055/g.30307 Transcript_17055/m.30307 type:complete len:482 (-) Transcript_17055:64-1509(-)
MVCCCFGGGSKRPKKPDGEDKDLQVGGRYRVLRAVDVWERESLTGNKSDYLRRKDVVLLINIIETEGGRVGLVVEPGDEHVPGYISLEDVVGKRGGPVLNVSRLEGSWEMKARYTVKNPCTLRAGPELTSGWAGELEPGDEVLVLDLGLASGTPEQKKARLRALVSTSDGKIGWLSPETVGGDHLLDPANLHSHEVVKIHRQSIRKMSSAGGPRKSFSAGADSPWQVGSQYRMLEKVPVLSDGKLSSSVKFKVSAGSLVTVSDLSSDTCPKTGPLCDQRCPMAFITVDDGPEQGRNGWVRCTAKDGHDVMDTRDHREYEKVVEKLRRSVSSTDASNLQKPSEIQAALVAEQSMSADQIDPQLGRHRSMIPEDANPGLSEDTDEDKEKAEIEKRLATLGDAFAVESQKQQEAQAASEQLKQDLDKLDALATVKEGNEELAEMTFNEKMDQLDEYSGQDSRLIVEPKMEVESKMTMCGCSCGR